MYLELVLMDGGSGADTLRRLIVEEAERRLSSARE
jgi:hypothetical protein